MMKNKETEMGNEYQKEIKSLNIKTLSKIGAKLKESLLSIHSFNSINDHCKFKIESSNNLNFDYDFNEVIISNAYGDTEFVTLNIEIKGYDDKFSYNISYLNFIDIISISNEYGTCTISPEEEAAMYDYSDYDISLIILSMSVILSNFKAGKVISLDQYRKKVEFKKSLNIGF